MLNRNGTCHSRTLTQNNCGYGWHSNGTSVSGGKCGVRKSDNHNKLDTRKVAARMSVNQGCHSVAGGVFLRRVQSVAAVYLFFYNLIFAGINLFAGLLNRSSSPSVLHPFTWRCAFRSGQSVPSGPSLWARESRNIKLILSTEGLNRPGLCHTKATGECVTLWEFPSQRQFPVTPLPAHGLVLIDEYICTER